MRLLRLLSLLWSFRIRWLCNDFNINYILERFLTPFTPLRHAWSMITSHIPSQMVVLLDWMVVPKTSGRFFSFTIGTIGHLQLLTIAAIACNCSNCELAELFQIADPAVSGTMADDDELTPIRGYTYVPSIVVGGMYSLYQIIYLIVGITVKQEDIIEVLWPAAHTSKQTWIYACLQPDEVSLQTDFISFQKIYVSAVIITVNSQAKSLRSRDFRILSLDGRIPWEKVAVVPYN